MTFNKNWLTQTYSDPKDIPFLFFWGHQPSKDGSTTRSCFSQWWVTPGQITREGQRRGRLVRNFDPVNWDKHKWEVVVEGNVHKFAAYPELKAFFAEYRRTSIGRSQSPGHDLGYRNDR